MGESILTQEEAWQVYSQLMTDSRVLWLPEPLGLENQFRAYTREPTPSHERWTDAYLAAFAVAVGLRLVTLDKGIHRFAGLDWLLL